MKKNLKSQNIILIVSVMFTLSLPVFSQGNSDELINSYWLTDQILIVGFGEMKMDMVAAVKTQKGIVIIDSGMVPSITAKHRSIIEKKFGRSDFKYVINTHHHGDHVNGNQIFKEAVIIAHKNAVEKIKADNTKDEIAAYVKQTRKKNKIRNQLKETLKKDSLMYKELRDRIYLSGKECDDYENGYQLTLPTLTFTDNLTLDMGDMNIEIAYFGTEFHSSNDIIVSIPEQNIVFTGDLIYPRERYHVVNSKSDIVSWIACLNKIFSKNKDIKKVVAYHVGILPGSILHDFYNTLKKMGNEQKQKKSAVERLKTMLITKPLKQALKKFEDQFLKIKNEDFYIWEGDLLSLASEYREKEKYEEALWILKMTEKIFKNSTRSLYHQGMIYTKTGKKNLAIEAYQKMLKLDPVKWYYAELIFRLKNSN